MKLFGLFLLCFSHIDAYNLLLVFPYPVRSLCILGEKFVTHLNEAGHIVTYITAFPVTNTPTKNFRQIVVNETKDIFDTANEELSIKSIMSGKIKLNAAGAFQDYAFVISKRTFENEEVKKLFADTTEKFDAVIADWFDIDVYAGISVLYDCPLIWAYSMGAHWMVVKLVDQATNPAYSTDYMSLNIVPLTFTERVEELTSQIKWNILKKFYTEPREIVIYNDYFGNLVRKRGKELPAYHAVVYNASLVLANDHQASGNIPPLPQNFKFVGGQHIDHEHRLPRDLQNIMDNAMHGVIYFSLGSTWHSKDMPESLKANLLKMFGELKQTVLWKYEEKRDNVPKNVHLINWAPQTSILAHPKCLIFVTHGGGLSSVEVVHFGVPIIGVPIFMDQFVNINKAVTSGYGLKVDLNNNLPQTLKAAIDTMLNDKKFAARAKELSQIYHDRLVPPGKELVHWVEHVVRTRGAPHMRSPALEMSLYQKMYLDLAAIVAIIVITFIWIVYHFFSYISSNKADSEKKKT